MGYECDQEQAGDVTRATIPLPRAALGQAKSALANNRIAPRTEAAQTIAQIGINALRHPITSYSSAY
ncbi:MAG TPA: hypothetical protein VGJ66_14370 [Pyrinomonadaceae bacterium]|jgi:hypothetical protein